MNVMIVRHNSKMAPMIPIFWDVGPVQFSPLECGGPDQIK